MDVAKKGLLNGTFVYFIGNTLVSIIQIILLRFITGNISPDGYGYYNTIVSIDYLITPVLTMQISDAVFRYAIKGNFEEKCRAVTNGTIVILAGILVTGIGVATVHFTFRSVPLYILVILYIVSTNVFAFYQKIARALGANISYVKTNLFKVFLYLAFQIVMITVLDMKEESLFIALILSTFISLVYLEYKINSRQYFSLKVFNWGYLKDMLKYSIPLVPNTMLWWFSSSVNSIIVTAKLGTDYNGIYSAAGRFSAIIGMAASVFNLAWQESAIKEYENRDRRVFYREIYELFYRLICSAVMVCIPLMYIALPYLLDKSYYSAIQYVPLLVVGAGFSAAYGFFGQMYSATGKTKGAAVTTFFGVIANLSVVCLFIDMIGLWAACIAVVLSGFVIMILRYRQFKEIMNLAVTHELILLLLFISLCLTIYYLKLPMVNYLLLASALVIAYVVNRSLIKEIMDIIKYKISKEKK